MVESINHDGGQKKQLLGKQFDAFGTPMNVKTPVNFAQKLEAQKKEYKAS